MVIGQISLKSLDFSEDSRDSQTSRTYPGSPCKAQWTGAAAMSNLSAKHLHDKTAADEFLEDAPCGSEGLARTAAAWMKP